MPRRTVIHGSEGLARYVLDLEANALLKLIGYVETTLDYDAKTKGENRQIELLPPAAGIRHALNPFEGSFRRRLRSALVISVHSFIEDFFGHLADVVPAVRHIDANVKDVKGRGFVRAKDFLVSLCGVDVPLGAPWERALFINALRNVIVHSNGFLGKSSSDEKRIRGFIAAHAPDVAIGRHGVVNIGATFLAPEVDAFRAYGLELIAVCDLDGIRSRKRRRQHSATAQ